MDAPEDLIARAELARFLDDLLKHCEQQCRQAGRELPRLVLVADIGPHVAAAGNVFDVRNVVLKWLSMGEPTRTMYEPRRPFGPL